MEPNPPPPRSVPPGTRSWIGLDWNAHLRYEWFVVLHNTWWDREEDPEWIQFAADWAREVYTEGRGLE